MPPTVNDGIPYLMTGDFCGINELNFNNVKHITKEDYELLSRKIKPEKYDIVFARYASVGVVRYIDFTRDFLISYSCAIIKNGNKINSNYLYHFLTSENAQKQIQLEVNTGSQANIGIESMKNNIIVSLPSEKEQLKISQYLRNLDHLITLHQRKYEKLIQIKKSMLEKMFPKNGEKTPEIRFAGFTDDWEQRKLGDVGSVAMCRRIFKEQTTNKGDIPFYKIGTFGDQADAYISRELFEEYKSKYPYPETGDILISASGSIGRTVEFSGNDEYFQDSNIVWLKHDDNIKNEYLKVLYQVIKWSGIEGTTIKRLYNSNILDTEFMLPSIAEQEKIGQYFTNLDHLITLHHRKLEKLKNIKKSMLEKMFV